MRILQFVGEMQADSLTLIVLHHTREAVLFATLLIVVNPLLD